MAKVEEHIKQWKHNRQFAESIDSKYRDWQITAIFYAALHAVDAALAQLKITVTDHVRRNEAVRNNGALLGLKEKYLNLYRISKVTRYDPDPDRWLPQEYLTVGDLVDHVLKPIENEVERLLGKNLKLSPLKPQP